MLIAVIVALAVGTYGFRLAGVLLRDRLDLPQPVRRMLPLAAAALLAALAGTAALTDSGGFAGVSRPLGVAVGAVLAWLRAPFIVVVVAAAATAAVLRLLGVP
jgi:branched-subunit amino acid transport protein